MGIPTKDELLVSYSTNWNNRLGTGAENFGLTVEDAATYSALHTPYVTAYQTMMTARGAGTRSNALTATRNTTKAALLNFARQLYATVQANKSVSDTNKALLGVTVPSTNRRPVPAPVVRPQVTINSVADRTVDISVFDPNSKSKRAKLSTADGAYVYSFVGTTYPSDPTTWQFCGRATKSTFTVTFPDDVAGGTQVWISAAWTTRTDEVGPASVPVSTYVQGGGANEQPATIKIAA